MLIHKTYCLLQGPLSIRYLLLYTWLVAIGVLLSAKGYNQINYNTEDGLPSNETYSIVRGAKGYLWVGSNFGLTRFDGRFFKTYGSAEGFEPVAIFKVIALQNGAIVFSTAENKVGILVQDSVRYVSTNPACRIKTVVNWKEGFIVTYQNCSRFACYNASGELLNTNLKPRGRYIHKLSDSLLIQYGQNIGTDTTFFLRGSSLTRANIHTFKRNGVFAQSNVAAGTRAYLIIKDSIHELDSHKLEPKKALHAKATAGLCMTSIGHIWVGTFGKGVQVYNTTNWAESPRAYLDGMSVSDITRDHDGNIWLTTLENGFYLFRPNQYVPVHHEKVTLLQGINKGVVYHTSDSLFMVHVGNKGKKLIFSGLKANSILQFKNNLIIGGKKQTGQQRLDSILCFETNSKLFEWDGQLWGVDYQALFTFDLHHPKAKSRVELLSLPQEYTYVAKVFDHELYIGRPSGLYKVAASRKNEFKVTKVFDLPVTSIVKTEAGYFLGTKGHGLHQFDHDFHPIMHYNKTTGLNSDFVSDVVSRNDTLFASTNQGINMLFDPSQLIYQRVFASGRVDGLYSGNVLDLEVVDNLLFCVTDKGLQSIPVQYMKPPGTHPIPIITDLDGLEIPSNKILHYKEGTTTLSLGLGAIFFDSDVPVLKEYRLLGLDTTWIQTFSNVVTLSNLGPGDYTLETRTKVPGNQSSNQASIQINIAPYFYQTGWFKITLSFAILLFVGYLVWQRERYVKSRYNLELQSEKLKYNMLVAQLNPHFIFNAMGSIQGLILSKDNLLAAESLSTFSKLIDQILQNTGKLFISLEREIEFIDHYVSIEKPRFEAPFEFVWQIAPEIRPKQLQVPTMFLQPFIENSIIHGVRPMGRKGKITVCIDLMPNAVIQIKIVDNGIGPTAALKKKEKRGRQSMAIDNIKTRIKIMNSVFMLNVTQTLCDLKAANGDVIGGIVTITIPYKQIEHESFYS